MGPEEWEGAARELLDATCTTAPVNALDLADALGFTVEYWARANADVDREAGIIFVPSGARPERMQSLVAHELGHVALDRAGLPQSERAATYCGGALLMPWRDMYRNIRDAAWSPTALRTIHVHAGHVALAVRITQMRTAALALFDPHGRTPTWRVASERVGRDIARTPTRLEHDLAIEAWNEQCEVRHGELVVATPLPDYLPGEHRVLVIGHVDELRAAHRGARCAA